MPRKLPRTTAWLVSALLGFTVPLGAARAQGLASPGSGPVTDVTVDIWPEPGAPPRRYTLQCDPPRGTVGDPAAACARIDALIAPLTRARPAAPAPPPPPAVPEPLPPPLPPIRDGNALCTQIYGGPAVAMIRGLIGGVPAGGGPMARRDGCEISGYDRNMELLGIP